MEDPSLWESRPRIWSGGLREGGEQRKERRRRFSKKPGSFKPGGQQTPPPHAAACSIAERSGCELAPRGAAWSGGGGGRGGLGSPARRIGPGKQHPFPLLLAQFNSHSARATPCRHRPLGQLSAWQHGLGRGREGRRCQGGAAAAARNYKGRKPLRHLPALFLPPLSARHQGLSQWGPSQGKRAPGSGCASGKACSLRRGSGQFTRRAKPSVVIAHPHPPLSLSLSGSASFFFRGNSEGCRSGFLRGGRWGMRRGRDILRQQVWLYGGPTGCAPELERREKAPEQPRKEKKSCRKN